MGKYELKYIHKAKHPAGTVINEHTHSCTEIILYVKGDGQCIINNNVHNIKNNTIAFIPPDTVHSEIHGEEASIMYFGFNSDSIPEIIPSLYAPVYFDKFYNIAVQLYDEVKSQKPYYEELLFAYICEFIALFGRNILNASRNIRQKSLEYCANYMKENCNMQLDIKRISKDFGYSYDNFRHIFKIEYGMAPQNFIIYQRLLNAGRLLSETDSSCTEIAMFCGFSDSSQFSKMFKRQYGISPKKYQENSGHTNL